MKKRVEVLHVFKLTRDEAAVKKLYKELAGVVRDKGQIKIRRWRKATVMYLVRK